MFDEDFALRCLPFDEQCASVFAEITAARTLQGRPVSVEAAQIAAIALRNRKTLVTHNLADFENIAGLSLLNPW
jgi:toxin FitB